MFAWFCVVAALLLLFVFVIWSKNGFVNLFIKFVYLLGAVWAIICAIKQFGLLL